MERSPWRVSDLSGRDAASGGAPTLLRRRGEREQSARLATNNDAARGQVGDGYSHQLPPGVETRAGKPIEYTPQACKILNAPETNVLLHRECRASWTL
jgi:hypothetical protein